MGPVITPAAATVKIELGLGYVLLLPLWIALIGVLSGRVLGVHIGRLRTTVAAIIGWFFGLIAGLVALGPNNQHPVLVVTLSLFFGVLASLPFAIAIDVLTRGGHRHPLARFTLRPPVRAPKAVVSSLGRFRQLVGYDLSDTLLHVRHPVSTAFTSTQLIPPLCHV